MLSLKTRFNRQTTRSTDVCLDGSLQLSQTPLVAGQRSEVRGYIQQHSLPQDLLTVHRFLQERRKGCGSGVKVRILCIVNKGHLGDMKCPIFRGVAISEVYT